MLSKKNRETVGSNYPFSTIIPVRITDINYGKHLGHVATVGIFHHARILFLNENGFDEMNVDGLGMILVSSSYSFKNEASFNEKLLIHIGVGDYSRLKFNFLYKAINKESGKEIVSSQEELVFFDYSKGKVSRIPERFLELCKKSCVKHTN